MIALVKSDLEKHRTDADAIDQKRDAADKKLNEKLDLISSQMGSLITLNQEVNDFKTAWRIGKKIGLGLAMFIGTMGVIFGGIYAVRDWLNK